MQAQSSDDSGSDPNGPSPKPSTSKRTSSSSGSKMWNRMSWFKRRSRSKENVGESSGSSAVVSPRGSGHSEDQGCSFDGAELDFSSPSTSTSSCSPLQLHSFSLGSSSSSESDLYDGRALGRDHQLVRDHPARQARPYPNSEVIEQSCLRPSVARALFLQLEAWMVKKDDRVAKYAWPKKKRACQVQEDPAVEDLALMMTRTQSMPGGMVTRSKCHCVACCSCSPKERLEGACPVYKTLNQSTTSLDTGLATLGFSPAYNPLTDCADTNAEISPSKSQPTHCNGTTDSPKCNSLPANSRMCPVCNKYLLPASSPLPRTTTTASCDNQASTSTTPTPPTLPDVLETCQCDQDAMPAFRDTRCRAHRVNLTELYTTELPKNTQQRVAPTEFKERTDTIKQWFSEFNDEQKNLILKQLLTGCDLPQLHLLSLEMESRLHASCPPNCQDRLSWLPQTVSFHIMGYLDPVSLCHASSVCKSWADVANEPSLWRRFCGQTKWRLSVGGEHKQLLQHMRPDGAIEWKKVFAERYRLRNNWIRGKCNVRTFTGHHQGISCVQFDDTRIVSGSSDKTIKVWNIRTNNPWAVQTLVGHSGTVRCLHLDGNRLVSGSTDSTIKVWDLSTQQSWSSIACKVTMVGHTDTVRCLQVDQEKVISGSYDKTLKVWDIKTGVCQRSLRGHSAAVLCVQFDDSKIVSGSCDKTIKVWNVEGDCMMTLEGHHDAVTCLQFDKSRIFSGSLDCNLKFWDIHSGQCVNTIDWKASEGHTGVVRCLQADSWRVVSASDDRTLKVWSLETGQRLVTLRNHSDGVTCLQFNDSIIVSGSYDKTVKLWDFSCC